MSEGKKLSQPPMHLSDKALIFHREISIERLNFMIHNHQSLIISAIEEVDKNDKKN